MFEQEEIIRADIIDLWAMYNLLINNNIEIDPKLEDNIKQGRVIKVSIHYIINEWYTIYPNTETVTVKGYGKYNIHKFLDEIDFRTVQLRQFLLENIEQEALVEARI